MNPQNQYVISLSKLTLPEYVRPKKLTLSAMTSTQQIFIQNHKNFKTNKINFYRETLFLTSLPQTLFFNIYQVDDSAHKALIKQLKVFSNDLREIKLRPSVFRTKDAGFELDWECCIFTEDSEELNEATERDYSQLELPFYNQEQTSQISMGREKKVVQEQLFRTAETTKKLSISTDSQSSPDIKQSFEHEPKDANWRANTFENKAKSPNKDRTKIKSHLYTQFVKMASELFSQSNST